MSSQVKLRLFAAVAALATVLAVMGIITGLVLIVSVLPIWVLAALPIVFMLGLFWWMIYTTVRHYLTPTKDLL